MKSLFRVAVVALALNSGLVWAQDWPSKPVRLIVPSASGGAVDLYARWIGEPLSRALKQPFVVENRAGAGGILGADAVAKSAPDGHTILVSQNGPFESYHGLYKSLPYNLERDFVPVARGVLASLVIIVPPSTPAKSVADLVEIGRAKPNTLTYGSAGPGSNPYLATRILETVSGASFVHVAYKGGSGVYPDLLAGRLGFFFSDLTSALPHIKDGKVRPLGVTVRTNLLPSTPTLVESGFPAFGTRTPSISVLAPAGTPPAIVQRLGAEIVTAMKDPKLSQTLQENALIPVYDTPDQFAADLVKSRQFWLEFTKKYGISAE